MQRCLGISILLSQSMGLMNTHMHMFACGWCHESSRHGGEDELQDGEDISKPWDEVSFCFKFPFFHYGFSLMAGHNLESLHPGGCALFLNLGGLQNEFCHINHIGKVAVLPRILSHFSII